MGAFIAWDAVHGQTVWEIKEKYPVWSGALATGGRPGLLRHPRRLAQGGQCQDRRGALEVQGRLRRGRRADHVPGPDGKQYVAVYAGIGGDWSLLSGDLRADDPADVRDPADFIKDLARYTSQGGMVWIFGLP